MVTAIAALHRDDDMPLLLDACARIGLQAEVRAWDDASVSWRRYDLALLRSPWDYTERLPQFLAWCERVAGSTRLLNRLDIVRWNTDKHYLAELETMGGLPIVPTQFVEPDEEPLPALRAFLDEFPQTMEFVVKPAVGAGSRDAQRYAATQEFAAANHIGRLLDAGRSAMLQPYLASVDALGETALIYFDGEYSHAIRKGPLLRPNEGPSDHLFAPESIAAREPSDDERALGETVMRAIRTRFGDAVPLPYARVDLIRDADGRPQLLELELTEPSLFFATAPGSAERFAECLAKRLTVAA
jgi:O-ureido-D-serine cyclo-ligase